MNGYTTKTFPNLQIFIRDDLVSALSDRQWQNLCYGFFYGKSTGHVQKQGKYKSILHTSLPFAEKQMSFLVKKYKNYGLTKKAKTLFYPSKALHELQTSLTIDRKGICTIVPVIVAEIKNKGFISESLQITPFFPDACELRVLFLSRAGNATGLSFAEKRKVIRQFGRLTARIFQNGIYQYDYALNNFMIRKEGVLSQLYFIDFERVAIKDKLSLNQKIRLLAKLNRVGHEVSIKDRLRFLKSYLEIETHYPWDLKCLAIKLQQKTFRILKEDLHRRRLTNIYTQGRYEKFKTKDYRGIYKRGYDPEEILERMKDMAADLKYARVSLKYKSVKNTLHAIQYRRKGAEKMWSTICTLILAGLPLKPPHILIEGGHSGFLLLRAAEKGDYQSFDLIKKKAGTKLIQALEMYLSREIAMVAELFASLKS